MYVCEERAARFHEAIVETQANDLSDLVQDEVKQGKTGLRLTVDGGPDYTVKSVLAMFAFGRLWQDQNLDFLIMCTHAPGDSAYNQIEHAWSPLSAALAGVTFPVSLPGQLPPWEQNLNQHEEEKKLQMFLVIQLQFSTPTGVDYHFMAFASTLPEFHARRNPLLTATMQNSVHLQQQGSQRSKQMTPS